MGEILPAYREGGGRGRIEISTSPYFHPILPLLCNINSAREALPNLELPLHDFHYAEDARWHIRQAVQSHERTFGRPPRGLPASEGSVSDEILPLIRGAGFDWVAADGRSSGLLRRSGLLDEGSAPPWTPLRQLRLPDARRPAPRLLPRSPPLRHDRVHLLHLRRGGRGRGPFQPADAHPEDAARRRPRLRRPHHPGRGECTWEYPENGVRFLRAFYSRLSASPYLKAVTFRC